MSHFAKAVGYGALAALALVAEHMIVERASLVPMSYPERYVLGTATLGAAIAAWGLSEGHEEALTGAAIIVAVGGGAVLAAYKMGEALEGEFEAGQVKSLLMHAIREGKADNDARTA